MSAQQGATRPAVDFGHRTVVLRTGAFTRRWELRTILLGTVLTALIAVLLLRSVASGDYPLTLQQIWVALTDAENAGFSRTVVMEWRLPRALAAIAFGAALGASGAIFQSLTRNPLASPDIIGFNTGAYTGALIVIIFIGNSFLWVASGAIVGGVVTAITVYLLSWARGVQGFRLIIVGIAVGAVLASFNTWLLLTAQLEASMSAAAWGAGTLSGTTWEQLGIGGSAVIVIFLLLSPLLPSVRQLELGDDAARATGAAVEVSRLFAMFLAVALTATVTAAAGPISFVALVAPQIARRLARSAGVSVWPAAFTGAFLLLAADYTAQRLLPVVLPVGVVTVVLGGTYLVWLLIREARRVL